MKEEIEQSGDSIQFGTNNRHESNWVDADTEQPGNEMILIRCIEDCEPPVEFVVRYRDSLSLMEAIGQARTDIALAIFNRKTGIAP